MLSHGPPIKRAARPVKIDKRSVSRRGQNHGTAPNNVFVRQCKSENSRENENAYSITHASELGANSRHIHKIDLDSYLATHFNCLSIIINSKWDLYHSWVGYQSSNLCIGSVPIDELFQ